MSQHAARLLRNLQYHIERYGSTDAGTIAVLKQVIGILSKRAKPIPKKRVKARRGPLRDPKYRRWCREQECALYINTESLRDGSACMVPYVIDPAHTERNGKGSKGPDSSCVPLCRAHHVEFDAVRNAAGRAAFDAKYGCNMKALAAEHWSRYLSETGVAK